jgi:hypothetical protein
MRWTLGVLLFWGTLSVGESARAELVELSPDDDVEGAINAAQPGDELVLAGGTYALTDRFGVSVRGTSDAPIVVRAADGETPVLSRAGADQNVIDIDDAEHVVFRGLEITGGSHGLRLVNARFVTVEGCEIHDTGDVALSANSGGSYEALRILRNHIHHTNNTGEGMYLGCNENACQMFDSLIEGNYVHHTNGPTVEQGDGIEIKEGSYNNIVRDNVIHDTNYPCILTYSTAGNGAPNVIERNVLWACGDHGIQSAADAIIRNNIILGSVGNGIAMQPHQSGAPDNLVVVHNTILHATNDAISASDIAGSVVIANNALYAQAGRALRVSGELGGLVIAGNVGVGAIEPMSAGLIATGSITDDFISASFANSVPNDVFPKAGSALVGAGVGMHVASDDFNGTPRNGVADVGAYAFEAGGNPGWALAEEPKSDTGAPADAGVTAGTGGVGGEGGGASGAGGDGGDAASGGTGATAGGSGSAAPDDAGSNPTSGGSADDAGTARSSDDGCSCRITGGPVPRPTPVALTSAAVALVALRRIRSRSHRSRVN